MPTLFRPNGDAQSVFALDVANGHPTGNIGSTDALVQMQGPKLDFFAVIIENGSNHQPDRAGKSYHCFLPGRRCSNWSDQLCAVSYRCMDHCNSRHSYYWSGQRADHQQQRSGSWRKRKWFTDNQRWFQTSNFVI